jgi:hypothetical protein
MYLTKEECTEILQVFIKESIGLLNEYNDLSKVYNHNDFNPNENAMNEIKNKLEDLNNIIKSIKDYAKKNNQILAFNYNK